MMTAERMGECRFYPAERETMRRPRTRENGIKHIVCRGKQ